MLQAHDYSCTCLAHRRTIMQKAHTVLYELEGICPTCGSPGLDLYCASV